MIYDNNKLLVDFLLFFTLFMALSWLSIRKFYGRQDQKGAAIGITISISLALAIGALAAGLSASFSTTFIKYALFFLGTFLVYSLITKLGKIESTWGKFAALLAAAVLLWLLFNVGNLFTWEGSMRPTGGGFLDNTKFTLGRLFDVPTRGASADLMPFLKWIFCILAGILVYYLIVKIWEIEKIWYKLLVVLAAILIAWLLCLAIGAATKKTGPEKSIWNKFTDWAKSVWPFGKGTTAKTDKAPEPEEVACSSEWSCDDWSECGEDGKQTRTCTDAKECNDDTNHPEEEQDCTPEVADCAPNWEYTKWSVCSAESKQTRTVTDKNNCGVDTNKPLAEQACTPKVAAPKACTPNWKCTGWNFCNKNGIQDQTCDDKNKCNTEENKPPIRQFCEACKDECTTQGITCQGIWKQRQTIHVWRR